jgi:saccharopine dehydrogenase-like NADP-dependent oxidoreductase
MKIVVLGGGLIGSAIVEDLSHNFNVTCADLSKENLEKISKSTGAGIIQVDLSDSDTVKNIVSDFDIVVGAVPGFMGFKTLKSIIEAGKNVVDISFFPENALELDALAKQNKVCAIVDCGVAPGMSNMIAGYHNKRMQLAMYECLVGGLPVVREFPFEYKAVFSPIDVIEEYTRPARFVANGRMVTKEALTDVEEIFFAGVGTVESFNTDGLRSLALTMPQVPNMIEKTLRYPGHVRLMRAMRETGLFSKEKIKVGNSEVVPLEFTAKLMFPKWKLQPGEEDLTIMRVTVEGKENGKNVRHTYSLHDRFDNEKNVTSMARTTAYTCTAAVNLLAQGNFARIGICPPEYVGEDEKCFESVIGYLHERKVVYTYMEEMIL